jgi:aconitate hydratase
MATQRVSKTANKKVQKKKSTTTSRARKNISPKHPNSFKALKTLKVGAKSYAYFSLKEAEKNGLDGISALPYSMKVLLENLLRHEDGETVTGDEKMDVAS